MLSHRMQQEQTFENLIQEARKQIPLYTKEWTNFNPSDPAETILENLSAFSILQQAYIDRMPESVQEKLFAMAGFSREKGRSARILLEAKNVHEPVHIPAGQRFAVGDLFFETNKEFSLRGNKLIGIFCKNNDQIKDYSYILDEDYPVGGTIFTDKPKAGMELYFVLNGVAEEGEEMLFYVRLANENKRNAFTGENLFAEIKWQFYTNKGFVNIKCKDSTGSFLSSGELRFRIPKEEAAVFEDFPVRGYVIKGILKRADYDIAPKIASVRGALFEVWQKETRSICYTYGRTQVVELFSDILEEGYVQFFCKEKADSSYYLYEQVKPWSGTGRFYRIERLGYGMYRIEFDREAFGYAPGDFDNAIKLVAYNSEMMKRYDLGTIYGYDDQKIKLPAEHVVKDSFCIIAEKKDEEGNTVYEFIKPSSEKEDELRYTLMENEGAIVINDAADYIDSRIVLGGCAVSRGAEGNIRADSRFIPVGYDTDIVFVNPARGSGGRFPETVAEVRKRLIDDLKKHYTAVEAEDYEQLVRTTPELCIDKVKAVRDDVKNQIQVTVKPVSNDPLPKLSPIYHKAIKQRLDKARLLTVNIDIAQPVYVPVHVRGTIYVKPHYEGSREHIERVIHNELDYITTNRNFGERFNFDTLFHKIEALPCVKYIYELSVTPQSLLHVSQMGLDIQPKDNCLLYPGDIKLELNMTD